MSYHLEAACLCVTGKVRANNEDNFYFDERCLPEQNRGLSHPVSMKQSLRKEVCVAVFDGMGGENYGEAASFAAADAMQRLVRRAKPYFFRERRFLEDLCRDMNEAVLERSRALRTTHMGSTCVILYFSHGYVYCCNLGDSRAYRLRDGEFFQLSKDHVEQREGRKKSPLTQHLGIDPEDFLIEPYIAKGELQRGDQYLLCSDGLTDMLTTLEIDTIMKNAASAEECAAQLTAAALEQGGKDNTTVIVCRIK